MIPVEEDAVNARGQHFTIEKTGCGERSCAAGAGALYYPYRKRRCFVRGGPERWKGVILMSVMEKLLTRRTYRRFEQKAVPQEVVDDIVEALRLSSSGANRQAVRLVVVRNPELVAKVQPLVKWAGYLPPEQGTPKAGEQPTLYVAVVQDTSIHGDLNTDTGIALANMTLAAWDKGVGSCIMGAINKPALSELLGIAEPEKLAFMVAFGYPAHQAHIVPMTEETGIRYYLDADRSYCVPKRSREELARYL